MKLRIMFAVASLWSLHPTAVGAAIPPAPEATTAYPDRLPVTDLMSWVARDDRTVYAEDTGGRWYRVDLAAPCPPLAAAAEIAFASATGHGFHDACALVTGGGRCAIAGIVRVAAPALPRILPDAASAAASGR